MSLILVATVGGLLLELRSWCSPERRVGIRRGGARDTSGHGERAAPVVYDRPLCQMPEVLLAASGDRPAPSGFPRPTGSATLPESARSRPAGTRSAGGAMGRLILDAPTWLIGVLLVAVLPAIVLVAQWGIRRSWPALTR